MTGAILVLTAPLGATTYYYVVVVQADGSLTGRLCPTAAAVVAYVGQLLGGAAPPPGPTGPTGGP